MIDYVELHCHSYFSLLDGASSPEALAEQAAALGMPALALTDHDAVYGVIPFVQAARCHRLHPLLGAELTLAGGAHLTLLVQDQTGWQNLCHLIGQGQHAAPKGEAALPHAALAGHTDGLTALSGCRQGEIARALCQGDRSAALAQAQRYISLFGRERFWVELQRHLRPDDDDLTANLLDLADHMRLGVVATNNVHYATRDGHRLQDVLVCIRHGVTLEESAAV
jgi:error-prone DNA polymerase